MPSEMMPLCEPEQENARPKKIVADLTLDREMLQMDCPNAHWLLSLADAAEKLEVWRSDCSEQLPHGTIGNKVPDHADEIATCSQPVMPGNVGEL